MQIESQDKDTKVAEEEKADEWERIKEENIQNSNDSIMRTDFASAMNSFDYNLPLNPDGTLSFYWIDAHEENNG